MTLLQLQDLTYRYKNTAEAVLYQINYHFEPGNFTVSLVSREQEIHSLVPPCWSR